MLLKSFLSDHIMNVNDEHRDRLKFVACTVFRDREMISTIQQSTNFCLANNINQLKHIDIFDYYNYTRLIW